MAHAHCVLDTWGYKHTLRICNTHFFSTTTMVTRSPLDVTLYVHCLSCYLLSRRLGGLQIRSGRFWEEKRFLFLPKFGPRFVNHPARYVVTVPTAVPLFPQHPNKNVRSVVLLDYKCTLRSCHTKSTIREPDWVATVVSRPTADRDNGSFFSSKIPDQIWDLHSLLFNGHHLIYPDHSTPSSAAFKN